MLDLFGRTPAFHLATKIYAQLIQPKTFSLPFERKDFLVRGVLNLSHGDIRTPLMAKIEAKVYSDWIEKPPRVVCKENWMKADIDWHVYKDMSLCWVLGDQWRDELRGYHEHFRQEDVESIASTWCLTNAKDLIYKHHLAKRWGITAWPKRWDAWRHGKQGRQDYLRENLYSRKG